MSGSAVRLPPPDLPEGPRSALVIATTAYSDASLRALRAPATDAGDFAEILADPAIGGFTVTSVIDRTANEMRIAIEEFLNGRAPEELVVVYVSCHGLTDLRRRLYFTATDTVKIRLAATGVESAWVLDQLDECRARSQVVILDCCFSGAFVAGAKGDDEIGLNSLAAPGRGRAVLTASNAREYSFEGGLGAEPTGGAAALGSVFTAALLAGLRDGAADRDGDGFVSVDEAYAYAYQHVRAQGIAQTPQRWLSGGEGYLFLARNPSGRAVLPAAMPNSLRAALDSPLPEVRVGAVQTLKTWLLSPEPGRILTAELELRAVVDNDISRVAAAARRALEGPRGLVLPSAPPSTPASAPVRAPAPAPVRASAATPRPSPAREQILSWPAVEDGVVETGAPIPPRRRRVLAAGAAALAVIITGVVIIGIQLARESTGPGGADSPTRAPALPRSTRLSDNQLVVPMTIGSNIDLYVAEVGKSEPIDRLTSSRGTDTSPNLSVDRGTVIYRHWDDKPTNSILKVIATDGSGDRDLLTTPPGQCGTGIRRVGWNPEDSSQLAVACYYNERPRLYIARTNGRLIRQIDIPEGRVGDPTFSPDGTKLAFWAADTDTGRDGGALYVADLNRTQPEPLTKSADGVDQAPTWSPDGKTIAFQRLVDNGTKSVNFDILALPSDGSGEPTPLATGPANEESPSFSPRGDQIAYSSDRRVGVSKQVRVWIMNSDRSSPRLLWESSGVSGNSQGAPLWSRR
jgi:Tol biopolymer transport system component